MPKANIKNLAYGLLGTFVSRNNDIGGYWSLGVLRLYAEHNGLEKVIIDLLHPTLELAYKSPVVQAEETYGRWLRNRLTEKQLDVRLIAEAKVHVRFSTFREFPNAIRDTRGEPYHCTVTISRRDRKPYVVSKVGVCAPHDPKKDRRSTRVDG